MKGPTAFGLAILISTTSALQTHAQSFTAPTTFQQRSYTNSIGMTFVEIPAGSFVMGRFDPGCPNRAPNYQPKRPNFPPIAAIPARPTDAVTTPTLVRSIGPAREPPARTASSAAQPVPVTTFGGPVGWIDADYAKCQRLAAASFRPGFVAAIRKSYFLSTHEVTQDQYRRIMGRNPSYFAADRVTNPGRHPVDSVTWQEAVEFADRLNALEATDCYRLPSEAEWEWAARSGEEIPGHWTLLPPSDSGEYGVFRAGFGSPTNEWTTAEVGSMKPNHWGLYDMLGNVAEWVSDRYNGKFLPDPVAPKTGSTHVLKGKSFLTASIFAYPTDHTGGPSDKLDVGFRIVCEMR